MILRSQRVIMNEHMRRFLEENWDEQGQPAEPRRDEKPAKKSKNLDRRQAEKQWGRSMAKFHREQKKGRQKPI